MNQKYPLIPRKTMAIIYVSCLRKSLSPEAQNREKEKRWPNKHTQVRTFSSGLTDYTECQHGRKEIFFKVVNDL